MRYRFYDAPVQGKRMLERPPLRGTKVELREAIARVEKLEFHEGKNTPRPSTELIAARKHLEEMRWFWEDKAMKDCPKVDPDGHEVEDAGDDYTHVASYAPGHIPHIAEDGTLHVLRPKRHATTDKTHTQRLQEYAAKIKKFWERKS